MKLISDREQAAADLQRNSEDDWEDLSEEPVEEEEVKRDLVMQGKRIALQDLASMLEFSMKTQQMMDKARLRFFTNAKKIKAAKVQLPLNSIRNC